MTVALAAAGAVALAWTAGIHLHLWADGYRHVPTIGPLFLLQAVTGIVLAVAVLILRPAAVTAGAAAFLVSTAGGLLLSNWVGLFGFHDHLDAPFAMLSLVLEGTGAVLLAAASVDRLRRR